MAPKKDQVHRRQFEMEVRIGISPEEKEPLGNELLIALSEIEKKEKVKKAYTKDINGEISEHEKKVKELRATLEQGRAEMRLVEETRNFKTNVLTIKEVESGRQVEKRQMTDEDAQIPISDLPNAEEAEEPEHDDRA